MLDGACQPKALAQRAKELGMTAVAITDHGVMYGVIDFYKTCKSLDIKPIIGCEVYINAKAHRSSRDKDIPYHHLVLLAKDMEGYKNLSRINTIAHMEGYYYKPRIDKETLRAHAGGLIALSACLQGEVNHALKEGRLDLAEESAREYMDIFGPDNFFLEMQDHGMEEQKQCNAGIRALAKRTGLRIVVTNDVHYLHRSHAKAHEVMLCIQTSTVMSDPKRMRYGSEEFYFKSREELEQFFPNEPECFDLTQEIADRCNVELTFSDGKAASLHFPVYDVPEGFTDGRDYLRYLGKQGLKKHYGLDFDNPKSDFDRQLIERFNYEVGIIEKTGFVNYFLVVADFIVWSRTHGVPVGPGRGSGAGSLLAYSLGITQIDPLRFDLIFERFLNPFRPSPPDIDADFADDRRDDMIAYVTQKYGADKVAQIITFGTMAARGAIRDVGRALGLGYSFCDQVAKLIPAGAQGFNMTLAKAIELEPDLKKRYKEDEQVKSMKLVGMQHPWIFYFS
jgi:DNA polymerase-3 subunit alpha